MRKITKIILRLSLSRHIRACERRRDSAISSSNSAERHDQWPSVDSDDAWLLGWISVATPRFLHHPQPLPPHQQRKVRYAVVRTRMYYNKIRATCVRMLVWLLAYTFCLKRTRNESDFKALGDAMFQAPYPLLAQSSVTATPTSKHWRARLLAFSTFPLMLQLEGRSFHSAVSELTLSWPLRCLVSSTVYLLTSKPARKDYITASFCLQNIFVKR